MLLTTTKRTLLALSLLCLVAVFKPGIAQAAQCETEDTITVAEMTWLSASTFAYITERVLTDGYGCNVQVVPGDTVPTATSMLSKSEPQIAPELWVSTAESIWEQALEKGNVYKASDIFADGGQEGWWIPDYVAEENPGLRSVSDLQDHAELFREAASGDKGRFYGCPPGWGCEIITNNLFKALDLENHGWELFSPGSGANLKASIARKVTRNEPIVGYYWGPTAVIGKYNLVRLEMPEYDPEKFNCLTDMNCADPQLTGWKIGEVAVAVVTELKEKAPGVAEFLANLQLPNETVNTLLAWGDDNSASPEEVATRFFEQHPEIWRAWVPEDVAERIQASL
jgi:glycine betaine/proline transport system substrate-binding protein